jgi:hypothetical protein
MSPDIRKRIVRLARLIRSTDGWRDDSRLRDLNHRLYRLYRKAEEIQAEETQRRRVAHAIHTRSHPAPDGLVTYYATMSGEPSKKTGFLI